jgi:hypothetical protein
MMPESREFCEDALNGIAGPTFRISWYVVPNSVAYWFKVITTGEAPEQADMIQITEMDMLRMGILNEGQKRQYLRDKFKLYFEQLGEKLGLG